MGGNRVRIKSEEDCKKAWKALSKEEKQVYINKYAEMRKSQKPVHPILKPYIKVKAILNDYNAKNPDNMVKPMIDAKMYNGLAAIAVILYCLVLQKIFFCRTPQRYCQQCGSQNRRRSNRQHTRYVRW
eukprot:TRINITY_DN3362_c0_g1_i1.p2 TRINITY_DN3362_c0_g1~~TRINITY_DN3362_c0_g1_i1.p2  ORF type:complete len:128 (+),score=2.46 TRINITY_DN3362_c0_g1_i1:417-800(+)